MEQEGTRPNPDFLPFGAIIENWQAWAGMAAFLSWVNVMLCFEGALRDEVIYEGGLVHDPVFYGVTATAALAFIVLRSRKNHPRKVAEKKLFIAAAALGIIGSGLATALVHIAQIVPPAASSACGVCIGVGVVAITIAWGKLLVAHDLRESLVLVSIAMCMQWVPFVIMMLVPFAARMALVLALPSASVALLLRHAATGETPAFEASREPRKTDSAILNRMAIMVFIFSATIQFIWTFFIKMFTNNLEPSLFPVVFAVLTVLTFAIMGLALFAMQRQKSYRIELYYRMAFLLCVCSAGAFSLATQASVLAYMSIYAGFSLVVPTLWMMALGFSFMTKSSITNALSLLSTAEYAGFLIGFALVDALKPLGYASYGNELSAYICTAVIFAFSVAYVWIFPERDFISLSPTMFGLSTESLEARCAELGERFGLTKREKELLELFACGRNSAYIEKELFISKNTVASHRKSIYRKMGVKTQQELLTLVEGN